MHRPQFWGGCDLKSDWGPIIPNIPNFSSTFWNKFSPELNLYLMKMLGSCSAIFNFLVCVLDLQVFKSRFKTG